MSLDAAARGRPVRPEVLDTLDIQICDPKIADHNIPDISHSEDAPVTESEAATKRAAERAPKQIFWRHFVRRHQ
jgi:hypothetical protein